MFILVSCPCPDLSVERFLLLTQRCNAGAEAVEQLAGLL